MVSTGDMLIGILLGLLTFFPSSHADSALTRPGPGDLVPRIWIAGEAPRLTVILVVGNDSKEASQLEATARLGLKAYPGSTLEIHTTEGGSLRINELTQQKGGVRGPLRAFPGVNCPDLVPYKVTEEEHGPFAGSFTQHIDVFGIGVFGTKSVPQDKLVHAAAILAQWLDDDGDGLPDAPEVAHALAVRRAFMGMTRTERERDRRNPFEAAHRAGFHLGQDLYASETNPKGEFDAALEECLHLVQMGWAFAWPETYGPWKGTSLSDCLDRARGGFFTEIPDEVPEGAWYHYDDKTCEYDCMAVEYCYFALTTLLGGQLGRAEEIGDEWECTTPEEVRLRDPWIVKLLTSKERRLPRVLPDGQYLPALALGAKR